MVDINLVIPIVLVLLMFLAFPLAIQFSIMFKVRGRHLTAIIEKGKPLSFKLLKIVKDDFIKDGEDEWILKTSLMKPVAYPLMWPKILAAFQQVVWCSLVMRGRSEPLNWEDPLTGALSSKEVPVVLDPHWLISLVKGVGEDTKTSRSERVLMFLSVGASVLCLVILFYVISRLGKIEEAITLLRAVTR